jgi:DNA-binding response OmpR family regulator
VSGKNVLIMSDNYELGEELKAKFAVYNFEVTVAGDGKRGLYEIFTAEREFSAVVIDDKIPLVSMVEVCRQLKTKPRTKAWPVLILSDENEKNALMEAQDLGVTKYIKKPVASDIVVYMTEQLLSEALTASQPAPVSNRKKIIVVDDEVPIARMLKIRLEANGFEVSMAHDGQAGLDLVYKENPDLILLDLVLPVIDGFTVCRILKFDSKYKNTPIIMLTARSAEESQKLGQQMGANAYFTKPFEPDVLLKKIEELLKISKT